MIQNNSTVGDMERGKFRSVGTGFFSSVAVVNADGSSLSTGIWTLSYDYIEASYPDAVTELYTTKSGGSGGSVQQQVTVVYTDSTKALISTVTRT